MGDSDDLVKKLQKENHLLLKMYKKQNKRIKYVRAQLEVITEDKLSKDKKLAFVQTQVNDWVDKSDKLDAMLDQQKQMKKTTTTATATATKKGDLLSKGELGSIKANTKDKLALMECIVANLYRVFSDKCEQQRIEILKLQQQMNVSKGGGHGADYEEEAKERSVTPNAVIYNKLINDIEQELENLRETSLSTEDELEKELHQEALEME